MTKPYVTHNDQPININGTHGLARLSNLSYHRIVEMFGEPSEDFDDYKSDAAWSIKFDDDEIATIYNWKNGRNYCGPDAPIKEEITIWNVGGKTQDVVLRLHQLLMKEAIPYV
jgi:hypothetical protein